MKFVINDQNIKTTHKKCSDFYLIKIWVKSSFFVVYIFDKHQNMIDSINKDYFPYPEKVEKTVSACFFPTHRWVKDSTKNKMYMSRQIGSIFLNKETMDPYVIQHECTHATLGYFSRFINGYKKGYNQDVLINRGIKEELFCKMAGLLTCLIFDTFYEIKQLSQENEQSKKEARPVSKSRHKGIKVARKTAVNSRSPKQRKLAKD